jgi:hypothetical protein
MQPQHHPVLLLIKFKMISLTLLERSKFYYMEKNLFLLLISIIISCSGNNSESQRESEGTPTTIVITDIHKSKVSHPNIDVVHFQSNSFAEIGHISKIIDIGDRYIINDGMIGNAVFIYGLKGHYINHIHRQGKGPGEYRDIQNIYYKEISNELVLFPMDERKKMIFDIKGNLLREEPINHSIRYADLIYYGHDELVVNLSHMDGRSNLVLVSGDSIIENFIPFENELDDTPVDRLNVLSQGIDQNALVSLGIRDTLYFFEYQTKILSPKYIVNFDNRKIDLEQHQFGKKEVGEEEKYMGLLAIFQNERILTFTTYTQDSKAIFFYDKLDQKLYSGKEVLRDVVANAQVRHIVGMTNDGRFIGVIEPDKAEPLVFKNHKKLQKTYDGFNISDPDDKLLLIFDFEPK